MTQRTSLSPTDVIGAFTGSAAPIQTLPDLLGLIAQSVQADMIQLGLDLGTGYRRDCFIEQEAEMCSLADDTDPPFVVMRETRVRRRSNPSGLIAAPDWVDHRTLPVGTAGRRRAPRSGIALMRCSTRPAFKPSERRQLTQLLPHLNFALALACELERARQQEASALAALERAHCGFLQLSPAGAPLHGNRLAFELLEQARVRVGSRLRLPSPLLQERFDAALACATTPGCQSTYTVLAPGPPPVNLTLHPSTFGSASGGMRPASLTLTLRGPGYCAPLPEEAVQHFGLTPAEFRLCAALVDGVSLKTCAQDWNRSYETLRSQLKTILAKTGTHRQAELVALLDSFRTR